MIKLDYKGWMLREAKRKAEKLGVIRNSITKGKGNIAGYLAEIALNKYLESQNVSCTEGKDKFNFDLIHEGKKIDVKCKRRKVNPEEHYEVSIAATSKHQQPDVYAFVSITFKEKRGKGREATYHGVDSIWLCGFMPRDEYFEKGRFVPKGKLDTSNGFFCKANMYNMPISDLYKSWEDIP